jgi:hypothetical protein
MLYMMCRTGRKPHQGWAWFCLALGLYPLLIAFGVITIDATDIQAPMWMLAVCGIVFVIGGCMLLLTRHARLNNLLAALICLAFAAVGGWVALFSPPEGFSGGIPLLSDAANIRLARWVFGGGAVISLALCGYAVRLALRSAGPDSQHR